MKIYIAADHAGFGLKEEIKRYLKEQGREVQDLGAFGLDEQDDYPDFILPAARKVAENPQESFGIVFGASGQGEAILANKVKGIRAAVYNCSNSELIRLSRAHNDANVLSIGARFISKEHAIEAITVWLSTDFSGEARHKRRLSQIREIEKNLCK